MRDVLRSSWWLLALTALELLGGCGSTHVGPNKGTSETHFLRVCDDSCEDGLSCVCGVCTERCTSDAVCTSLAAGATCASHEAGECGGTEAMRACELTCEDDVDCAALGGDHRCQAGACRAEAASGPGGSGDRDGTLPAEGPACVATEVTAEISVTNNDKVDLLFVVDNSASMAEEQASLRAEFPKLIATLTTGTRADGTTFPPAKDLHLGVVSSDLGAAGISGLPDCAGLGDDGIMRNDPSPELSGCQAAYPRFLTYIDGVNDPGQTSTDFACVATLGTDGCSFEQPLEAGLKALWPSIDFDPQTGEVNEPNRIQFLGENGFGELGHGDQENNGFLRNDPAVGQSVIAIIVVTDEEDCSSADLHHFVPPQDLDPQDPLVDQPLNLRCFNNAQNLYPLERYINGLKALRPGNENMVLFAAIAGVPPDLTEPEDYGAVDWSDEASRDAFYDRLLNDPRMQEAIDPNAPDGEAALVASCSTDRGRAYPPRRLLEVAHRFGVNGTVHSICQEDLGPAVDGIIELIVRQLGAVCLPRPLVRNAEGLVGSCELLWELPPVAMAGTMTPAACGEPGFEFLLERDSGDRVNDRGGATCRVPQLAVQFGGAGPEIVPTEIDGEVWNDGWYYDDFSEEVATECPGGTLQRIAFAPAAKPPTGVVVKLHCLNETYPVENDRPDANPRLEQPVQGDPCDQVVRNGQTLTGDQACAVQLTSGELDNSMYCHPQSHTCVLECQRDADCSPGWICDQQANAVTDTRDGSICVAPSCSAGPASATSQRVGDACQPGVVPAGGFDDQEAYLATGNADCGGGVCMVYRLDGDPSEGCVSIPPDPGSGDPGRICATASEVLDRVYCTCRCDAPDGYAECGCPDGFSCVDALEQGGDDIRGGYCVRDGTF